MEGQTMRRVALLCAWMLFAAACGSALVRRTLNETQTSVHNGSV